MLIIYYLFMKMKKLYWVCLWLVSVREIGVGLLKIYGIIVIVFLLNFDLIVGVKFDVCLGCWRECKGEVNNWLFVIFVYV